ncbi:DNA-directed RNA polymerase subunit beta [bacterium]|nr:DNA-directed RNA polymerase subunit beta [bacterium]
MTNMTKSCKHIRRNFGSIPEIMDVPDLIEIQKGSYESFLQKDIPPEARADRGLQGVFKSIFPIGDFSNSCSLEFVSYSLGDSKYRVKECRQRGMTYAAPLKLVVRLIVWGKGKEQMNKTIRDIKEQEIYLGEIPLMTDNGTFIINGTERAIVSQMHRSPGVFFGHDKGKTYSGQKILYTARVIPYRGSWIEFEICTKDILYLRIDRRRKIIATVLLRALGIDSDEEILKTFYQTERIILDQGSKFSKLLDPEAHIGERAINDICDPKTGRVIVKMHTKITRAGFKRMQECGIERVPAEDEQLLGHYLASDIVDKETGEILFETNTPVTVETLMTIREKGIPEIELLIIENSKIGTSLRETVVKDNIKSKKDALVDIYKRMRPGDPPTQESAQALFDSMFFDLKRYDLSNVGRLIINRRLGLDISLDERLLTTRDFIETIRYLFQLQNGVGYVDDIDHLGNRRVRSVGELLENQFRVGLVRMERAIKERMSMQDMETVMPHDIVNSKPVSAVVKEFFGSSQLSQFLDQTNPLSELTHKRRLSALGPGSLSRERAGFEVRDVHTTHYGRICPIETPEGPNIGLIASLSTYARVNEFGFIETPYRKVTDGRVTSEIVHLTASEEEKYAIAQANAPIDQNGYFTAERVNARQGGEFKKLTADQINFMDVSPKQLVSASASLIPFLEHDDANRALMGSNMQRQGVPLLKPNAPLVGTGMEAIVARDSGAIVVAKRAGIVESVNANRIIIRVDQSTDNIAEPGSEPVIDVYELMKFQRSNQNTCLNQRPVVKVGQKVDVGELIADGSATDQGDLALGQNVLVAFMPWGGYNFEDAILISENLVKEDCYTSIHIEEFEIEARDTKLGREEITRDIPNVSDDVLKNLDESGIIRIGAEIKPGDILVGKVTPKGETQLTPEEKLLRAIFGEKAADVRDASLIVPPGIEGVVVDVKVFSRKGVEKDKRSQDIEDEEVSKLKKSLKDEIKIVQDQKSKMMKDLLAEHNFTEIPEKIDDDLESIEDFEIKPQIEDIKNWADTQIDHYQNIFHDKLTRLERGGELPPGVIKLVKVYVAMKRKLSVGDKMAGRHGNKGVVSKILPQEDMPFLPDGTPVEIVLNPLGVPSRMNVGQILETHLGWAAKALGIRMATPVFDGATVSQIKETLKEAGLPESGRTILYDGRTGEPFEQDVTVGLIYIIKLAHLVDDKIHARSIGPYSLVTQQPLGGKAQFGGQRFGEMEVWALEAYGAAYTLQEILTVKSDDVPGRTDAYEAIVKGEDLSNPGVPESFNVLVKELQSLCLDVELLKEDSSE